jgi:hypothetical protein
MEKASGGSFALTRTRTRTREVEKDEDEAGQRGKPRFGRSLGLCPSIVLVLVVVIDLVSVSFR